MVYAPTRLRPDSNGLWRISRPRDKQAYVSIVICTYGRPDSLSVTLASLHSQTYKGFEVILITEKGNLSQLRQTGLEFAEGNVVAFIDDDVFCPETWLKSVVECFVKRPGVVGVTGPTEVTSEYRKNRDIFKYKRIKRLYNALFLDSLGQQPSYLSQVGAPSTSSNDAGVSYNGRAGYLEACNMAVRKRDALSVGGFDRAYTGTSEWCEVDLALKLKTKGELWYSQDAKLYHRPSKAGIYSARLKTLHRWNNFITFQRRWVKPTFRARIYGVFIWVYLKMKSLQMI